VEPDLNGNAASLCKVSQIGDELLPHITKLLCLCNLTHRKPGSSGSNARVEETAARFGDMEDDGYRRMLGVETTNACTDSVRLDPGGEVTLSSECAVGPP
jgi:hypothetical protein